MQNIDAKEIARGMLTFIDESPTCFHAVGNAAKELTQAGYQRLSEKEDYQLTPGGKYYLVRNDAAIIAFSVPKAPLKGFRLIASHSDSPCFKLKQNPDIGVEDAYGKLNVEKYGGMILSTWLDRPLSVAGRVIIRGEEGLETRLVNLEENLCIIPNVAIHFNREINKGVEYNPQVDMQPLWTTHKEQKIASLIAQKLSIDEGSILDMDLFLYNRMPGTFLGEPGTLVAAPRLDDLACVYTSLQGFLEAENEEYMKLYCVFDHEEVGSRTRQGADSDFLQSTLENITEKLGCRSQLSRLMADSMLLSADNGHALHPNHPEKSDATNRPVLNGGIVIKYQGSQQYTTDAATGAVVKEICRQEDIPFQTFQNRADIPGGSTLGNISIAHCSIPSADVGLPQLAMHSSYETAGALDPASFVRLARAFYEYPL